MSAIRTTGSQLTQYMRYYILIYILIPFLLPAQSPFQIGLTTQSGYAYNVFKGNEQRTTLADDGSLIQSIQSSFYQRVGLKTSWEKQLGKHEFSVYAKGSKDIFYQLSSANLTRLESQLTYTLAVQPKAAVFLKARLGSFQTNRAPDDTEVLPVPTSYRRRSVRMGYEFKPLKRNKSMIMLSVLHKGYLPVSDRELQYTSPAVKISTTQRLKKKGKRSAYLHLEADISQRNYLEEIISEEDPDDPELLEETRIWQYQTVTVWYSFKPLKTLKIKGRLDLQQRLDKLDQEFGYQQWKPIVEVQWKETKTTVKLKVAYISRLFSDLAANETETIALHHQFFQVHSNATFQLNEHWYLSLQFNITKRWRNMPIAATNSYLGYLNVISGIGLRFQW